MELFGYLEASAHQPTDKPQPQPQAHSLPVPANPQPKESHGEEDFDLESWQKGSLTATCWV